MKNDVMKKSGSLTHWGFLFSIADQFFEWSLVIYHSLSPVWLFESFIPANSLQYVTLVIPSLEDDLYSYPRKKTPSQNPLDEIFYHPNLPLPPIPTYSQIH